MIFGPEELAFRARALAQAHPLTPRARRVADQAAAVERREQPLPELATWASAALVTGYCLRRVEENAAGLELRPADGGPATLDDLEEATTRIASELRERVDMNIDAASPAPAPDSIVAALDRIIGSEVERRLDHWRDELDDEACAEIEEYLTWWVVRGYALRVAEMTTGVLA